MGDLRKWAMVDNPTIPLLVDRAGLRIGGVVNPQSHRGHHHPGESKQCNDVAHQCRLYLLPVQHVTIIRWSFRPVNRPAHRPAHVVWPSLAAALTRPILAISP